MSQDLAPRHMVGASEPALRHGVRDLNCTVATRQFRVHSADSMHPVLSGFKAKFGQQASVVSMNNRCDAFLCWKCGGNVGHTRFRCSDAPSPVTLSGMALLAIADKAKLVQAVEIEISKEGRAARLQQAQNHASWRLS